MAQATIAAKIHQTFNVHLNFSAQITFNQQVSVDVFTS